MTKLEKLRENKEKATHLLFEIYNSVDDFDSRDMWEIAIDEAAKSCGRANELFFKEENKQTK